MPLPPTTQCNLGPAGFRLFSCILSLSYMHYYNLLFYLLRPYFCGARIPFLPVDLRWVPCLLSARFCSFGLLVCKSVGLCECVIAM